MMDELIDDYQRIPGLFRVWDLPFVLQGSTDWRIFYAELTQDGTPLFAVYRRAAEAGQ